MSYKFSLRRWSASHTITFALYTTLLLSGQMIGCDSDSESTSGSNTNVEMNTEPNSEIKTVGSCDYINLFSSSPECKNYVGSEWTLAQAESDCSAQQEAEFKADTCDLSQALGDCRISSDEGFEYDLVISGDAPTGCQEAAQGCVIFARGIFNPTDRCVDQYEPIEPVLPEEVGNVFVPFELMCLDGTEEAADKCTWQAIGGCAPDGEQFTDYATCTPVLTQRPYAPIPPSDFETPNDDPLQTDQTYLDEVEWVRSQAKSCGCVCCHADGEAPSGAAVWDADREGIWTDDWNPRGLAMGAGWVDSSALGAFDAVDNNGFDRSLTVLPTTDVERMVRFFEGELARRGYVPEDFSNDQPIGGPLYEQARYVPSACENGEGVGIDGEITWAGGGARYVYVLSANSQSPGVPPNYDVPEGVIWKLDVDHRSNPVNAAQFGEIPVEAKQAFPLEGAPTPLELGQQYYLYVLRDIAVPITRCLFTYGDTQSDNQTEPEGSWGQACTQDTDCSSSTDFCVLAPGDEQGYCSVHCSSASSCEESGAPGEWACVAVSCEVEAFTWCGEPSEVEASGGFLKLCP